MPHYDLIERDPNITKYTSETPSNKLSRFEKMSIVEIKNSILYRLAIEEHYEGRR